MVAAIPLADPAGNAGLPGHCCLCGRVAPTQLCRRCFATHADDQGTLPAWVLGLRREATRQAVAEYRARRAGYFCISYDGLGDFLLFRELSPEDTLGPRHSHDDDERALARFSRPPGGGPAPRRLHRKGAAAPPVAPQVTEFVTGPDALATLRRYSPSGVPLDMPAFLALLGDLFGWPPPGAIVDRRHREALIDLYERVYEA
jgi:hypothetical protein